MWRMVALAVLLLSSCERSRQRSPHADKQGSADTARDARWGDSMKAHDRTAIAEQVFAKLAAGKETTVADLGTFTVREYKAYEGRNPRTGEMVRVPAKRLAFFMIDSAVRSYLNGTGKPPTTAWVAALLDELATKPVIFGRLGAFTILRKPEAVGRDPQRGTDIVIPARTVLTFRASTPLKRKLNAEPDPVVVASSVIDAALAKLPDKLPRTVEELDAALAQLAVDHAKAGLVAPAKRRNFEDSTVLTSNADDDDAWVLEGTSVVHRTDEEIVEVPIATWAGGMLVVGVVRNAASGGVLAAADLDRVLARLGPHSPFGLPDLPF